MYRPFLLILVILVSFLVAENQESITAIRVSKTYSNVCSFTYEVLFFPLFWLIQESTSDDHTMRIVGGVDTRPYEFPWMVQVISYVVFPSGGAGGISCAGTLISDQWVLTTASCFNINKWVFIVLSQSIAE